MERTLSKSLQSPKNISIFQIKHTLNNVTITKSVFGLWSVCLSMSNKYGIGCFCLLECSRCSAGPMERVELVRSLARYRGICGAKWD